MLVDPNLLLRCLGFCRTWKSLSALSVSWVFRCRAASKPKKAEMVQPARPAAATSIDPAVLEAVQLAEIAGLQTMNDAEVSEQRVRVR